MSVLSGRPLEGERRGSAAALWKERKRQEAVPNDGSEQQQQALARHINNRSYPSIFSTPPE